MDTVDVNFTHEWLDNIQNELGNRKPDYLVVHHMEPDHSANIANFLKTYPQMLLANIRRSFRRFSKNGVFSEKAAACRRYAFFRKTCAYFCDCTNGSLA